MMDYNKKDDQQIESNWRVMKPRSCDDICRAEAAASTPHPSQSWPLAFTISGLD